MAELIPAIRAPASYVNVHTSRFPAGEIRGQIADEAKRQPISAAYTSTRADCS